MKILTKTPEEIVDAIIDDIMDRRALSDEWDMIDPEIRDEIRARWIELAS